MNEILDIELEIGSGEPITITDKIDDSTTSLTTTYSSTKIVGLINDIDVPTKTSDLTNDSNFYSKPNGGIPSTDLTSAVQVSLGKADTALQQHQSLAEYAKTADVNTALAGKQNTLTAGDGIKLQNNTISLNSWRGTQAQYDALSSETKNSLYLAIIIDA